MVRLSVVIPALGRADVFGRVLDGLARQSATPGSFEVVVGVDAAEADPEAIRRATADRPFAVRVVQAAEPGVSAARNAAWRLAEHDVILFLGADMLPSPELVARHADGHRRDPEPDAGLLGHVRWARELRQTAFMRWLDDGVQFDFGSIRGDEAAWWHFYACNVSLKRSRLEAVGGFDEAFRFGYEELDLALRLHHAGFRLRYDREAEVEHLHQPTIAAWQERMRVVAAAERQFVAKHPEADAYFHDRFERAAAAPPARDRGVRLAEHVPRGLPVIGTRVHFSADRWFAQQLAPAFLRAWREVEPQ
jgi:GT2 family glycosyltransferase